MDLQQLFFKLTLDTSTEYLFGESVDSLRKPDGSPQQIFSTAFDAAQIEIIRREQYGPLKAFFTNESLRESCKIVHQYVDNLVHQCLDYRKRLDEKGGVEEEGGKYVFLNELAKATQNPKRIRDELLNMLLAGRDTTAGALGHLVREQYLPQEAIVNGW